MDLSLFLLLFCATFFYSDAATIIRKEPKKIKVCVIGAGPGGLSVGRRLLENNQGNIELTIFEQSSDVGGIWQYSENVDSKLNETYPTSSAAYKSLRTNLPSSIMGFPGYPINDKNENSSFSNHEVIFEYLKNFTSFYHLGPHIKFNARVENVSPLTTAPIYSEGWKVSVKNLTSAELTYHEFDRVIVCTGHYAKPRIPKINGFEDFKGQVLHSHSYRKPDEFFNKTVLIIGSGFSALDISQELAAHGSRVYLSTKSGRLLEDSVPNLTQVGKVWRYSIYSMIFYTENPWVEIEDVNVVIYCTGYDYYYPFLKPENTDISVDDNYVHYLYKHIVNVHHPSMTFVGIAVSDVPFLLLDTQAQYVAALIKRGEETILPARKIMEKDAALKAGQKKDAHDLIDPWRYFDELAEAGKFPKVSEFYKKSYDLWAGLFASHFEDFRNFRFITDSKTGRLALIRDGAVHLEAFFKPKGQLSMK